MKATFVVCNSFGVGLDVGGVGLLFWGANPRWIKVTVMLKFERPR